MTSSDDGADDREPWPQRLAPIAAAAVLIAGIGFLMFRSGPGGESAPTTTGQASIATVQEPEEPLIETTVPNLQTSLPQPTAPPLVETTIPATTEPATTDGPPLSVVDPPPAGPTKVEVDAALLRLADLEGTWTEEIFEPDDLCGANSELENATVRGAVLFQQVSTEPPGVRQLGHQILSFPDEASAERAFTTDVDLLEACTGTTIDVDGVGYRVEVSSDRFDEQDAAAFPCSDQNALLIVQLTNDAATVPFLGQSAFSFRCGRNVMVVSLATTLDLDDLNQDVFFAAGATANTRSAALVGSS